MKEKDIDEKREGEKKTPFIDRWIKGMLLGRDTDGFPAYQENFLRQGIKEFPFPESQLFKMLVTNFLHCTNYGEGQTASEYINAAFNGQKGFKDFENCTACGEEKAEKKCSSCKAVYYCDQVTTLKLIQSVTLKIYGFDFRELKTIIFFCTLNQFMFCNHYLFFKRLI